MVLPWFLIFHDGDNTMLKISILTLEVNPTSEKEWSLRCYQYNVSGLDLWQPQGHDVQPDTQADTEQGPDWDL